MKQSIPVGRATGERCGSYSDQRIDGLRPSFVMELLRLHAMLRTC